MTADHSKTVIDALKRLVHASAPAVSSPCGVPLETQSGRYAVGQQVLAPGLDDCSPRSVAEVLASGTRPDLPGHWCLVRICTRQGGMALVQEASLSPARGARQ